MKRLFPLSIVLAMLVGAIISSPKAANGQSAGLVSAVLNLMERNRQSLKSLKASLSMEKYNAQLRDAERFSGVVLYMPASGREASVRIDWQSPQREILAVSNGKYTLFRPRLNTGRGCLRRAPATSSRAAARTRSRSPSRAACPLGPARRGARG